MEKKQVKRTRKMNSEEDRLVSFSKRRSGIYKKASELSTLCSAEVGIVIFSPNGKPFSFGHPCMETITEKVLSQNNMNTVVPCDHNAQNFLAAYRRVRINELHQNYKEACKQMKAAKDQEKKIKKKNLAVRPNKGWWEEPIIVLDMDGLRQRADLIQELYNHVHLQINKLQSMAAAAPYSTFPSSHTAQAVGHGRGREC